MQFFVLVLFSLTQFTAVAQQKNANQIDVVVGWTKPPYVISQSNSGFELDLVRTIFEQLGKSVNFMYVPYGRSYSMLKQGKADVVMTLKPGIDIGETAVLSSSYISYQNVLISRKKKKIKIRRMADIADYSIVGFQNAHLHLGDDYNNARKRSSMYLEMANQQKQVEMLILDRVDLVAMDINIFKYWLNKDHNEADLSQVDIHRMFKPNPYHLGLLDSQLKNAFDKKLAQYKKTEQYQQLLQKYRLEL